jgi:hypothetical protein
LAIVRQSQWEGPWLPSPAAHHRNHEATGSANSATGHESEDAGDVSNIGVVACIVRAKEAESAEHAAHRETADGGRSSRRKNPPLPLGGTDRGARKRGDRVRVGDGNAQFEGIAREPLEAARPFVWPGQVYGDETNLFREVLRACVSGRGDGRAQETDDPG